MAKAEDDERMRKQLEEENERNKAGLDAMKNKVLEMQIASAFDRGKNFEDTLKRHGGKADAKDLLKQLEDKMEHVEGLLLKDEDR